MPYCPVHGERQGKFCADCGAPLQAEPSAPPLPPPQSGDTLRIRSNDITINVPGGLSGAPAQPGIVVCPLCGLRNPEPDTFDCRGPCGQRFLCREHLDRELFVCIVCAGEKRRAAEAERTAREVALAEQRRAEEAARAAREAALAEQRRQQRERAEARKRKLAQLRDRAEAALAAGRWQEARDAAEEWLAAEPEAKRATELLAEAKRGPVLRRTASGLVIATPDNAQWLLQQPRPPQRVWWEKAEMELCLAPAGEFLMGSAEGEEGYSDERPQHKVYLDAYYMGRYPVTRAQYARLVQADVPRGKGDHLVVDVSWHDAQAYCVAAGLSLPTEAQWEKAARGTDGRRYPWGNQFDAARCNTSEGEVGGTTPVGQYSPRGDSPYGCADMAGNVWEWCTDWHDADYYARSPARNPAGPDSGEYRVLRGGSWLGYDINARSAGRFRLDPVNRVSSIGFRCCVSPTSSL